MVRFLKDIPAYFSGTAPRQLTRRPLQAQTKAHAKAYTTGLVLTLGLILGGCATTAPEEIVVEPTPKAAPIETPKQTKPPVAEKPTTEPPVTAQPDAVPDKPTAASGELENVSVYTIDNQCNNFVEKTVQLPSDKAMAEAVGQAISAVDYNAFKLEGYEISVNGTTAVVDMKLSPSSERKFVSLSSCEQRALFGSVEETLRNNPEWGITAVKFTNRGQEIVL